MAWQARVYVWLVPLVAVLCGVLTLPGLGDPAAWGLPFAVLASLAVLAQVLPPLVLGAGGVPGELPAPRPALAFLLAGVLLLPPGPFVLLVGVLHLCEWAQKRWGAVPQPAAIYLAQVFNLVSHVLAGLCAGALYGALLVGQPDMASPVPVLAVLCTVVAYVALQHLFDGFLLVLTRRLSWTATGALRLDSLLPDFLTYLLGAAIALLWAVNSWLILVVLPPLVLLDRALEVPALRREARTDSKTGLLNARAFGEAFVREFERGVRTGRPMALIMADLDFLRNTNNTYGHLAGDAVLAAIGATIDDSFREYDIAGRFGGEEFAIVLPDSGQNETLAVAERLRQAVAARPIEIPTSPTPIHVTLSLGLACYPGDATTPAALIHAADVAVYQAKLRGRNCVVCAADVPHFVKLRPGIAQGAGVPGPQPPPIHDPAVPAAVGAPPAALTGAASPVAAADALPAAPPEQAPATPAAPPAWHIRLLVGAVIAAGVAVTVAGFAQSPRPDLIAISVFTLLTVLFEVLQVNVYGDNTASVATATIFATALIGGIPGAATVSAAVALTHYVRQRPALYKTAFNWSTHLLAGTVPVLTVAAIGLSLQVGNLLLLVIPIAVAALVYFVVDTGLIACAIGLSTGARIPAVWHKQFQWMAAHYLVLGVIGLFLDIAYTALGPAGVLVFTLPVLMMRQVQQQYVERTKESMQELKRLNSELAHANREVITASHDIQQLNDELFLTLAKILDARDPYVGGHAAQVSAYATAIARDLGLPPEQIELVRQAGFLHDIGKIAISEQILHKPGRLTAEEYEYVQTHATIGADLLETSRALRHLAPFVRGHHERWDGKGYPHNLRGEEIPLEARILAVCDAVEAMASDRPYQAGKSVAEVIAEVRRCAGTHFDPRVVESFVRLAGREGNAFVINSAREVTRKQGDPDVLPPPGNWVWNPPPALPASLLPAFAAPPRRHERRRVHLRPNPMRVKLAGTREHHPE